jgi:amino acid adenylation domain-containing protein
MNSFRGLDLPWNSVIDPIDRWGLATPAATAVEGPGGAMTYRELRDASLSITGEVLAHGCAPNDRIGVEAGRNVGLVATILGIWRAGCIYVPLASELPPARHSLICREGGVAAVMSGVLDRPDWRISSGISARPERVAPRDAHVSCEDGAYLLYTSGSTGDAKAVEILHGSLVFLSQALVRAYGLRPGDRALQLSSTAWDTHLEEIVPTLVAGGTVVIPNFQALPGADQICELVRSRRVTVVNLPTALWDRMVVSGLARFEGSRILVVGGEPMRAATAQQWMQCSDTGGPRLFNAYGLTEACAVSAVGEITARAVRDADAYLPIGEPIQGTRLAVITEDGRPAGSEEVGELVIWGAGLGRGVARPGKDCYHTGDSAATDARGQIVCLGRRDLQVKVRGVRVSLLEVESALKALAIVVDAVVVDIGDNDARLACLVQRPRGLVIGASDVREALGALLPRPAVPGVIEFAEHIPALPSGKPDRQSIIEMLRSNRQMSGDRLYSRGSRSAERVARVIAEALEVDEIDSNRTLLELGGDSLSAMIVVATLRSEGVSADVETLLSARSIAAFARGLTASRLTDALEPHPSRSDAE